MASRVIIELVQRLAQGGEDGQLLRSDPAQLAARQGMTPSALHALIDADRFFESEKPILQGAPRRKASPIPLAPRPKSQISELALVASSDTGTLLPGPDTGTVTVTGTQTGTALAPALAPPGGRNPLPAAPKGTTPAPMIGPAPSVPPALPIPVEPVEPVDPVLSLPPELPVVPLSSSRTDRDARAVSVLPEDRVRLDAPAGCRDGGYLMAMTVPRLSGNRRDCSHAGLGGGGG